MRSSIRTREELSADPAFAELRLPEDYEPFVRWEPSAGAYVIAHTAIYFCPWCGAQLPNRVEEALAEARKTAMWISVDPTGRVEAQVCGTPVDPSDLIAKLSEIENDE